MKSPMTQALYYAMGIVVMKGVSLVMMPVMAHYLSPAEYGRLDVLVNFINVAGIVIALGLTDAMFRFCGKASADGSEKVVVSTAFICSVVGAIFFAILLFSSLKPLAEVLPGEVLTDELAIAIATLILGGGVTIPLAWLRMQNHARQFFFVSVAKGVAQAVMSAWCLVEGMGVKGVLIAGAISQGLMTLYLVIFQLRDIPLTFNVWHARGLMVYGAPLVLGGLFAFLASGSERWLIAGSIGAAELGHYAIAMQLSMVVATLVEPFSLWFYPRRFALLNSDKGEAINATLTVTGVLLSLAACLVVVALAPLVVIHGMSSAYLPVLHYLPWLALAAAIRQASQLMNLGCYAGRFTWVPTTLNGVTALFAIAAFSAGVLLYGMIGVVIATILLALGRWMLFLIVSQRMLRLPYDYRLLAFAVILTVSGIAAGLGRESLTTSAMQLLLALLIVFYALQSMLTHGAAGWSWVGRRLVGRSEAA